MRRERRFLALIALPAIALACAEQATPPVAKNAFLPDSAEQMLFTIQFLLTDDGLRRAEVVADTAFTYDQNTRTELRNVNTTFYTTTGEKDATLTAKQGTHSSRLGTMEARGAVVVITTNGKKLETEQLKYDPSRNEVTSDVAFTLTEKDGITQGIGFVTDPKMNTVRVLKAFRRTGQSVTLPKK